MSLFLQENMNLKIHSIKVEKIEDFYSFIDKNENEVSENSISNSILLIECKDSYLKSQINEKINKEKFSLLWCDGLDVYSEDVVCFFENIFSHERVACIDYSDFHDVFNDLPCRYAESNFELTPDFVLDESFLNKFQELNGVIILIEAPSIKEFRAASVRFFEILVKYLGHDEFHFLISYNKSSSACLLKAMVSYRI